MKRMHKVEKNEKNLFSKKTQFENHSKTRNKKRLAT
jgi:hypothetical protein